MINSFFLTAEMQRLQSKDSFSFADERSANENFDPLRDYNIIFLDNFSDFWMRVFFDEQGRTRLLAFGVLWYVEGQKPRRTPLIGKIATQKSEKIDLTGRQMIYI